MYYLVLLEVSLSSGMRLGDYHRIILRIFFPHFSLTTFSTNTFQLFLAVVFQYPPTLSKFVLTQSSHIIINLPRLPLPSIFYIRHKTQDTRHKTQDTRHKTQDTRHKTQDTRHKTQDTRHKTQDTRHKTQDTRHKTQDTRHKTQDTRHKTQDTRHKTQDTRHKTQDTRHKTQDTRHKTQDTRHKTQDTRHKTQEALFNVGLHVNLITLAHLSYFPTNKCKATRHNT